MKNLVFALLTAAVLLPAAPAAGGRYSTAVDSGNDSGKDAKKVLLKETVTVNSRRVYIGDLFRNAGNKADIAIAYAPRPGQRAIFDARWLYRVARAYNLDWRPLGNQDQVVVERKSHADLEKGDADLGGGPIVQAELPQGFPGVHGRLAGGDDSEAAAGAVNYTAVKAVGAGKSTGQRKLEAPQPLLLRHPTVASADGDAFGGKLAVRPDDLDQVRIALHLASERGGNLCQLDRGGCSRHLQRTSSTEIGEVRTT